MTIGVKCRRAGGQECLHELVLARLAEEEPVVGLVLLRIVATWMMWFLLSFMKRMYITPFHNPFRWPASIDTNYTFVIGTDYLGICSGVTARASGMQLHCCRDIRYPLKTNTGA